MASGEAVFFFSLNRQPAACSRRHMRSYPWSWTVRLRLTVRYHISAFRALMLAHRSVCAREHVFVTEVNNGDTIIWITIYIVVQFLFPSYTPTRSRRTKTAHVLMEPIPPSPGEKNTLKIRSLEFDIPDCNRKLSISANCSGLWSIVVISYLWTVLSVKQPHCILLSLWFSAMHKFTRRTWADWPSCSCPPFFRIVSSSISVAEVFSIFPFSFPFCFFLLSHWKNNSTSNWKSFLALTKQTFLWAGFLRGSLVCGS